MSEHTNTHTQQHRNSKKHLTTNCVLATHNSRVDVSLVGMFYRTNILTSAEIPKFHWLKASYTINEFKTLTASARHHRELIDLYD